MKILVVVALEADRVRVRAEQCGGEREWYLTVSLLTMPNVDLTELW